MAARTERDIERRTFEFAVRVLKMVRSLPTDICGQIVARQLARSASSVGANVEESQGSHSRAEFILRMGIARSEARESLYWIRLSGATGLIAMRRLKLIQDEADQLVRILTAIVKTSRRV